MSLEEDSFKTSISWESPIVSLLVSSEELLVSPFLDQVRYLMYLLQGLVKEVLLGSVLALKTGLGLAIEFSWKIHQNLGIVA